MINLGTGNIDDLRFGDNTPRQYKSLMVIRSEISLTDTGESLYSPVSTPGTGTVYYRKNETDVNETYTEAGTLRVSGGVNTFVEKGTGVTHQFTYVRVDSPVNYQYFYYSGNLYEGSSLLFPEYGILQEAATLKVKRTLWGKETLFAVYSGVEMQVFECDTIYTASDNKVNSVYLGNELVWGNAVSEPEYRAVLYGSYGATTDWYALRTEANADVWIEADMCFYGGASSTYSTWYMGVKNGNFPYYFEPHGGGGFVVGVGDEQVLRVKDKNIHHIVVKPDQGFASLDGQTFTFTPKSVASGTLGTLNMGRCDGPVIYSDAFGFARFKLYKAGELLFDLVPYENDQGDRIVFNLVTGSYTLGSNTRFI